MRMTDTVDAIDKDYCDGLIQTTKIFELLSISDGFCLQTIPLKKGSYVFRSRYSKDLQSFMKISKLSYSPNNKVDKFSRLTQPGQSMFYASESFESCLAEMLPFWWDKIKIGEVFKVTIGKWEFSRDVKMIIIPDTDNINEFNNLVVAQLNSDEMLFWNYISKKFKMTTKQDSNIYKFTSAISNAIILLAKLQKLSFDGFVYSSVQSQMNINIGLVPQEIDNGNLFPKEFFEKTILKCGVNESGLPIYREIGNQKRGQVDLQKGMINWI